MVKVDSGDPDRALRASHRHRRRPRGSCLFGGKLGFACASPYRNLPLALNPATIFITSPLDIIVLSDGGHLMYIHF